MSASVNYRTDFKTFEVPAEGAEYTFSVPFRFSYYTTGATAFVASHCNGEYNNCELLEDGRLKVTFDNHGLAPGRVLCHREFYLTDEDYNDGICNAVFDTTTDIFLTLSGSDLGDITVELPPFYQKGDPFKWEDMTAEQRDYFIGQVGADVVATNEAVIAAEAQRVIAENERSERFESVMQEATTQAGYAKEQGDYAYAEAEGAKKTNQDIKDAEAQRVLAEQERGDRWAELSGELDTAITQAGESSSNADAATERANKAADNADAATERANKAADNADAAREAIQEDLGRKANTDGTYTKMTVGFAENIVGDGSATAEEFSFRPTAGVNRNTLNDGAARIRTLKGNSVVVNQQNKGVNTRTQYGYQTSSNGATITITNVSATTPDYGNMADFVDFTIKSGHRYLAITDSTLDLYVNSLVGFFFRANAISDIAPDLNYDAVWLRTETNIPLLVGESESFDFEIIDLTLMFGAGNEPTTVAEFYQRMPLGADLDVYNEGTIVDGHYGAIKTTGFNQWDEQWEQGAFDYYTGAKIADNSRIRSKNFIPVFPATQYYYKMPTNWQVCYWDAEKQFISASQNSTDVAENTPQNCHYITFDVGYSGAPITEYNNDICISLYWPTEYGDLYGTYQPYKPFERDLSWVAKYFPNGMRSAGNVADEIRFNSTTQQWEAVQRVGVVDLGSLEWSAMSSASSGVKIMRTFFDLKALATNVIGNITSEKFTPSTADDVYSLTSDKTIAAAYHATGNYIAVYDSEYPTAADVSSFKASLQGVLLNYELAEPIVTPITENINFDYDVSDYGTEELIVAEGVESAPLSASIEYSPNVLAVLKNAPDIANEVDMLKSQITALTAQLAALIASTDIPILV